MTTVRELLVQFGIDFDDKGGVKVDERLKSLAGGFRALAPLATAALGAFGVGLGVAGVKHLLDETSELGANILDVSKKLGVATDELQELRYAAELSGGSVGLMDSSLTKLSRSMAEAASGGKEQAAAFRAIGVSVKGANGEARPAGAVMEDVADAIAKMQDPAKRVNTAMQIFGRSGAELIPLLGEGGEGIRKLRQEAQELGGVLSKDLIEASDEYDDQMVRFRKTLQGVRNTIALSVMPSATRFLEWLTDGVKSVRAFLRGTKYLQSVLAVVAAGLGLAGLKWLLMSGGIAKATAALRVLLPLLGRLLWPIALVAALAALIDDLNALFTGGKSLIGAWLDELLGVGTAQLVVDTLKDSWELLNASLADGIEWLVAFGQSAATWIGEEATAAFRYLQEAGEGYLQWMEDVFGAGFVERISQVGRDAVDALLYPFRAAGKVLGKLLGFDEEDLARALDPKTFETLRGRQFQLASGRGLNAGLLAGPSAGQANATQVRARAAAAATAAAPRAARAGARVSQRRTNNITVNGASDPEATAAAVERRIRELDERDREDAYEALTRSAD